MIILLVILLILVAKRIDGHDCLLGNRNSKAEICCWAKCMYRPEEGSDTF